MSSTALIVLYNIPERCCFHSFYGKHWQRPVDMQLFESIESRLTGNIGYRRLSPAMSAQRRPREHHQKSESRVHVSDSKTVFDIHWFRPWVGIIHNNTHNTTIADQNNIHAHINLLLIIFIHYVLQLGVSASSNIHWSVSKLKRSNRINVLMVC